MIYYNTYLSDVLGNNYVGIKFPNTIVDIFLNDLKEVLGDSDFEKYTSLQKQRDHGSYHMTVINVMDYNELTKKVGMDKFINSLDYIFKFPIDDLKMLGIGMAERNENKAYFIVCESEKLDAVRARYGLNKIDFHITLGFYRKDVHGVRKNKIIDKNSNFIKLLAIEFYKRDNWNFIRNISNFDLDANDEIIPVKIDSTKIKVKCGDYYMDINWLDDIDKFWISTKYPVDVEYPRLPETEISKILKNKLEI